MYTILHLETSSLYKTLIKEICEEIGAKYHSASTAAEAISIIGEGKVSLILTAMELEGGSSVGFIKQLNESIHRNIPVVVITGNDSLDDRKMMYDLGIVDYILKITDRDTIKQNLLSYTREDPIDLRMGELSYAVLDDNQMDRKIIERIFSMQRIYDVDFFETGESFLASAKNYDIYFIDFVLKTTSGDKVIMKLKEKHPEAVIITISGIDNVKTISRVLSIGAVDYLTKPFNYDLFTARLKTNVRNYLLLKEVKEQAALLERMSVTDSLTELYNRRFIFERLDQESEKSKRYKSGFSLIMLDVDHFKKINDTYGHQQGDRILQKISAVLRSSIRNVDIAGRYGVDEFMVILPSVGIKGAVTVAERIREGVENLDTGKEGFSVTISGGASEYAGEDLHAFIKKVDNLLYAAKEKGRNRIEH